MGGVMKDAAALTRVLAVIDELTASLESENRLRLVRIHKQDELNAAANAEESAFKRTHALRTELFDLIRHNAQSDWRISYGETSVTSGPESPCGSGSDGP